MSVVKELSKASWVEIEAFLSWHEATTFLFHCCDAKSETPETHTAKITRRKIQPVSVVFRFVPRLLPPMFLDVFN